MLHRALRTKSKNHEFLFKSMISDLFNKNQVLPGQRVKRTIFLIKS